MGIKLGTKLSDSHKKAISDGIRKAIDKGWKPNGNTWKQALESITPEAKERRAKNAGKTMAGRPQRMDGPCGKHSDNKGAKLWRFENKAKGKVIEGKNLNQLIRDNVELFEPDEVIFDACGCKASRCLRTLKSPGKGRTRNSWKGWVIAAPRGHEEK